MIVDLENSFLGVERYNERLFRQFAKKFPKVFKRASLTVISFGALIYEMITGNELRNISQLDNYPPKLSQKIHDVLKSIFVDHSANNNRIPTLQELADKTPFNKGKK